MRGYDFIADRPRCRLNYALPFDRLTLDDLPRPVLPEPNGNMSPAPAVVVQCLCGLVERMDRKTLDRFTRDLWKGLTTRISSQ
jgi:hypothetical protein